MTGFEMQTGTASPLAANFNMLLSTYWALEGHSAEGKCLNTLACDRIRNDNLRVPDVTIIILPEILGLFFKFAIVA